MQRLQPMQTPHFGSKMKIQKSMSKSIQQILRIIQSCSVQKTARKNTKYSRNEAILKIGHYANAIVHAKSSLWVKNRNSKKKKSKSILKLIQSCSVQKTAGKSTKYLKNETFLKIGHYAKAIAHAKSSLWVKNYNSKKHVKIYSINSTNHLEMFCAKNRSRKTPNIQEMRPFLKSAMRQRLQSMQNPHFGSKTKFQKTCQNPLYKSFRVVLCKNPHEKTPKIGEMSPF